MQETNDLTPLGNKILKHWSKYRPKMVASLKARNHLQQSIFAAQELTRNLLYELTVITRWIRGSEHKGSTGVAEIAALGFWDF